MIDVSAVLAQFPELTEEKFLECFPLVEPGVEPLGERVLLQIRTVREKSTGGIYLAKETQKDDQWNTQVALVRDVGALAFCSRSTGGLWPEGVWAKEGDFVRIPRWGGDRFSVDVPGQDEKALFVIFKDHELIARVTMNPMLLANHIL